MTGLPWITFAIVVLAGLLAGSIPFALLIGLARGVDIRTQGSGNVGATNLGRALGFRYFLACFVLDAAKGLGPTLAFGLAAGWTGKASLQLSAAEAGLWLAVVVMPVLGHMFSPWIGFKGGNGVATGLGALLGVFPALTIPGIGAFVVFLVVFGVWRYVSLASVLAAASLPLWTWQFFATASVVLAEHPEPRPDLPPVLRESAAAFETRPWVFVMVTALLGALVIWKHRSNIGRLVRGTEPKVGASRAEASG